MLPKWSQLFYVTYISHTHTNSINEKKVDPEIEHTCADNEVNGRKWLVQTWAEDNEK